MSDTFAHNVRDAGLIETKALPNGAATVYSDGIDLGPLSSIGARLANISARIVAPVLTTAQLPDTYTMKYTVQHDDDSAFGSAVDLYPDVLVQTGAGSAGAAAASKRYAIPVDCKRYIRIKAVNSGAGNASTKSLTHELLF